MFANPWGFIISLLPQSSNFLYLLLGTYFPQIFFLILPTQLKCHLFKETWDDYSHNNTPALSTLPLISPYLIFFSELATVWSYLVYLFVYFLITTSPSLSTEQNHQDCRECGHLAEIWSSVLVLLLAHSMYPIRIFWRKKKKWNDSSFLIMRSLSPEWKTWARSVVLKVDQQDQRFLGAC